MYTITVLFLFFVSYAMAILVWDAPFGCIEPSGQPSQLLYSDHVLYHKQALKDMLDTKGKFGPKRTQNGQG